MEHTYCDYCENEGTGQHFTECDKFDGACLNCSAEHGKYDGCPEIEGEDL
jgi:hypothetical protein